MSSSAKVVTALEADEKAERNGQSAPASQSNLISFILKNPAAFIFDPRIAATFPEEQFSEALKFFSDPIREKYVFSVSTDLIKSREPQLDSKLLNSGISTFSKNRYWPFWHAAELLESGFSDPELLKDYLLELWSGGSPDRWTPRMHLQAGRLFIEKCVQIGKLTFFLGVLPVREWAGREPNKIAFVFDPETKVFYTLNARIRYEESEHRFRYIEFVAPHILPPNIQLRRSKSKRNELKVLLVLDRHIGDNLSLFTTHIPHLAKVPQFELTLDASMCPLFESAPMDVIRRFVPNCKLTVLRSTPSDRAEFDLVFDPYDWMSDGFNLKPQNDSGAISIVSGLEYGRCYLQGKRRDILDIHMGSLKRMGLVSEGESRPDFVSYHLTQRERTSKRQKKRLELLRDTREKSTAKIISFFPYGCSEERRYPVEYLQTVIGSLLQDPTINIVIAGASYDTPEMALTLRSDWKGVKQPCRHRIKLFSEEPLEKLIDLMLASDVVVSMDSGPLHLARALRINPLALYTDKVNDPKKMIAFPWFVEDGTVGVLKPKTGEKHVLPSQLVGALYEKLTAPSPATISNPAT